MAIIYRKNGLAFEKVNDGKVEENLSKLKSKGIIERVGPDKGGYWRILK